LKHSQQAQRHSPPFYVADEKLERRGKRVVHQLIMTNPNNIKGRALLIDGVLQEEGGAK
jgi:hypothetical protein